MTLSISPQICKTRCFKHVYVIKRLISGDKCQSMYSSHIPTTFAQKAILAVGSGLLCFLHPERADLISLFGEASGTRALKNMRKIMSNDPEGLLILRNQPRLRTQTLDMDYLRGLPNPTFGKHYANFMDGYHYSPDERMEVNFVDDVELAYVMQRYRESHDLVHTILGQKTNMFGEVVVKWVEGLQLGLPLGLLGGYFGALRLKPIQTKNYLATHLSYAIQVGLHSRKFICVYWENYWEMDINELRTMLKVPPPPKLQFKPLKKVQLNA